MTVSLNPRPRSPRKVIVHYGTPSLTVVEFKPPTPEKPKSGIKFVWQDGKIIRTEKP